MSDAAASVAGGLQGDIARVLEASAFFGVLSDAERAAVADGVQISSHAMGETIFKEGDAGDCLYLILSGRVRIQQRGSDGKPLTLAVLNAGEVVGEMAVITGETRGATARISDDAVLGALSRDEFQKLMAQSGDLKAVMERLGSERSLFNLVRGSLLGQKLPRSVMRKMLPVLQEERFAAQTAAVSEGETGDKLFVIVDGRFRVTKEIDGRQVELARLGPGEIFGERALVRKEARAATVTAIEDSRCLTLSDQQFETLFVDQKKARDELEAHIARYRDAPAPPPPQAPATAPQTSDKVDKTDASKPRTRRLRLRYPIVRQHLEVDCGAACLAMIGKWYGKRYALAHLRDLANVTERGASIMSLAQASETMGFSARALRLDENALRDVTLPAILFWDGYHYVVLWKMNRRNVVIGDPDRGLITVPMDEFRTRWSGFALSLTPGETLMPDDAASMLSRILPMVYPYKAMLFEVGLAAIVVALLGLAMPMFTQVIMDEVLPRDDLDFLNVLLAGMILVSLCTAAGTAIRQLLLIHIGQRLGLRLSNELFKRLLGLPIPYFRRRRIGDIMARFQDNKSVEELLTGDAVTTVIDGIMVVVYFGLMAYYSMTLTSVAFAYLLASTLLILIASPVLRRNNQALFERSAATQTRLIEALQNVETIKATGSELNVRWEFENNIVDEARQGMKAGVLGLTVSTGASLLQLGVTVAVLWLGARQVVAGDMTIGELVAFQALIMMAVGPVSSLVGIYQKLQDALLSLERLSDIYDAEPEEKTALAAMPPIKGAVSFQDITFGYVPDEAPILRNVSLEVNAGETIAIVGRSGSGKSTLFSLIQRFYHPDEGRVLIDGLDIATVSASTLRRQIGVVLQDPQLFTGTIRENISYGHQDAQMSEIIEASKLANAHDFIQRFPLGYDTMIGEVGVRLSGGQRQRIAIARALLPEPPLILFDEATSALDTESERAIQRNLNAILKGRTAFVIAHRLSTIRDADRIVVLDEGMVVEQGTADELMAKQGLFYYLVRQQSA